MESTTSPAVSIVIPTYGDNRWGLLVRTVAAARSQLHPAAEIVVVADHSPALYRRARRTHDRRLRSAVGAGTEAIARRDVGTAVGGLFEALLPAVPYAPSTVFLGAERAKLAGRSEERPRVALIADGIEAMHGVTHTVEQIRERGVPGFEVEVVGTDPGVDRRLPAATSLEVPFYAGLRLCVPGLPDLGFDTSNRGLMAKGDPGARLTREANTIWQRLHQGKEP